jgi:hypothetical protein
VAVGGGHEQAAAGNGRLERGHLRPVRAQALGRLERRPGGLGELAGTVLVIERGGEHTAFALEQDGLAHLGRDVR